MTIISSEILATVYCTMWHDINREFLERLSNYLLFKKDFTLCRIINVADNLIR